jgi:kumamolisin
MADQREPLRELPDSRRAPTPGAVHSGALDPEEQIELTLVLRRRRDLSPDAVEGHTLTATELGDRYGASPADIEQARDVITAAGAEVLHVDAASRRIRATGAAGVWSALFGTELTNVTSPDPTTGQPIEHRHRTGTLHAPAPLADVVVAVLGLDNRPQARANFRWAPSNNPAVAPTNNPAVVAPAAAVSSSYTPLQLATAYGFPASTDGTGQTLAIIELGGGYGPSDLSTYFKGLKLSVPKVTAVGVDGAKNVAGQDPNGADGEVLLDIEVAGAIAPKANLVVYFAPNTDAGFLDAIATATHATPTPTAISISWGQSEDDWTGQARTAMDAAIADACALGATVTVAAGDDGSTDRATDKQSHVDFPASSPHALACGGTSLDADPSTGSVTSETVWNNGTGNGATGGGVSDTFPLPSWQGNVGVPTRAGGTGSGRGVPDVAADADPSTGYQVYVDGKAMVYGGTSAVAPLWAALVCRLAQELGHPLGQLQPALYANAKKGHATAGLRDITSGNNGAYKAGKGWDACTGLGVPTDTLSSVFAPAPTAS